MLYALFVGLFHLQHQSLEVFSFGMVDVDGVICRLMDLMQDSHVAPALCGCGEYGEAELVLVYGL